MLRNKDYEVYGKWWTVTGENQCDRSAYDFLETILMWRIEHRYKSKLHVFVEKIELTLQSNADKIHKEEKHRQNSDTSVTAYSHKCSSNMQPATHMSSHNHLPPKPCTNNQLAAEV